MFYKIRTEGVRRPKASLVFGYLLAYLKCSLGPYEKLKTGRFVSFSSTEKDVTAMGVEEKELRKTVQRCRGVD